MILPPELFEGPYFCRTEDEALFARAEPVDRHPAVVAMQAPAGLDVARVRAELREEHGMVLGGGQAELKGKILRMGTMGELSQTDLLRGLEALETVLRGNDPTLAAGSGMHAARAEVEGELAATR